MTELPEAAAVIFDLDGTLLNTEPLYTEAANRVLEPFGHSFSMELKRRVMGRDSRHSAQMTIDEYDLPHTPEEFLKERETHLQRLFAEAVEIPGASQFLAKLMRAGQALGLATSSNRPFCDIKLSRQGWRSAFGAIVCGDDPELNAGKPSPDIFLLCAERLEVDPARALAFEDSTSGVASAKAAGMTVVAISSPYVRREDLHEADLIVEDYRELV